jgi:hypothetical protein
MVEESDEAPGRDDDKEPSFRRLHDEGVASFRRHQHEGTWGSTTFLLAQVEGELTLENVEPFGFPMMEVERSGEALPSSLFDEFPAIGGVGSRRFPR